MVARSMLELLEVAAIDVAPDGVTQNRVSHVQYTPDEAWPFGNPTERPMIPFPNEEAYPVGDVSFVRQLFHEILRLSPHAIARLELSVESLCMDFAPFVSDNAREVNRIQEQQRFEMIHQGGDQKIISAWSGQIAKQRKDRMGARVFRVAFEPACLQRIGIR
jgi:hypothetical protein